MVSVGDEVEVVVLDVDHDRERISLGIKQTTEDPWLKLAADFPMDSICDAEITRLVPFGAFVKLNDDVEGLIHVSEMAAKHIDSPAQVVHIGDVVKAKVVGVNEDKHRISLSMREAAEELGIEIEVDEMLPQNVTSRNRSKVVESTEEVAPAEEESKEETPVAEGKVAEETKEDAEVAPTAEENPSEEAPSTEEKSTENASAADEKSAE